MFAHHVEAAIGGTRSLAQLDGLAKDLWTAWGAGRLVDDEAQRLGEALEAKRREVRGLDTVAVRAPAVPRTRPSYFPPRRPCVSPDRAASRVRRRRLAASGPMPPALAAMFTTGELAALHIVAAEVRLRGACAITLGEIAARAGVCVTHARNAIRAAARAGLVTIEERRRYKRPNLANVVRIVSREWAQWIERRPRLGGGSKRVEPTDRASRTPTARETGKQPKSLAMKRPGEGSRKMPTVDEVATALGRLQAAVVRGRRS